MSTSLQELASSNMLIVENYGAQAMNKLFADTYENYWVRGVPSLPNNAGRKLSPPNILLLDFAGEFDGFVEACVRIAVSR